ncbi:MAG: hypothetical protein ACJ74W_20200 [Pyrinomonadaceae bacterium]
MSHETTRTDADRATTVRFIFIVLALCAWDALGVRAYQVFAPDSVYVQPFNSDSALPVLMANDAHLDAFHTYNYGQDQIGAWPFLAAQLVHRATGYTWTAHSVYFMQLVWLWLSLLVIAALCRECALLTGVLLAVVLCLHPTVAHYLFVLNQRYAWQVTPLLFTWLSLRQLCARNLLTHLPGARTWFWALAVCFFALLAVWTSPLSTPVLCALFMLEILRVRLVANTNGQAAQLTPKRVLKTLLPLVAAVMLEQLLKANYHRFALKHYGTDFKTPTEFDWPNLALNLQRQWAVCTHAPWWPLALFGTIAGALLTICLLYSAVRGRSLRLCQPGARLDLSVLSAASAIIALANFAVTVLFTWVRLNSYGSRYLALTHLFGTLAGLLALVLLVSLPTRAYTARSKLCPALAVCLLILLALLFPPVRKEAEYERLRSVAAGLAQRAPGGVLLGGYWDTYVFAALAPKAHFVPVPAEDQLMRTPWTPQLMRAAAQVVVVHHVFPNSGAVETPAPYTTFGDGQMPPPVLRQHGVSLRLVTPHWYEQAGYIFSLYQNERAAH